MRRFVIVFVALCSFGWVAFASPEPETGGAGHDHLLVGTREALPFAIKGDGGKWAGMSIDLWDAIARDEGLEFEYVERGLDGLVSGVESGELDAAISALTITSDREKRVDFSHPYYSSGLGIAVKAGGRRKVMGLVRGLFSRKLLQTLGLIGLFVFVVGCLVWFFERRVNPEQFGGPVRSGLWSGFWWSAVTMTTVGYGDKSPVSRGGRIVALIWMIAGLVAISVLTASMASALTLNQLQGSIAGPEDLPGASIGTIRNSTSAQWLDARAIGHRDFDQVGTALEALDKGSLEAVVYDSPILRYLTRRDYQGRLEVLEHNLDPQSYGIMFQPGSELREPVNRSLLRLMETDQWKTIRTRYFGEDVR